MYGLEVEDDLGDGPGERIGRLVLIAAVNDQAVVAADVHAGIGGKGQRHRLGQLTLSDQPIVGPERHPTTGGGDGLMGIEQHPHRDIPGGERLAGHLPVGFDAQEGVGVVQVPLFVDP